VKHIVILFSSMFFGVFTLLIVMTIYGDLNRSMELKSNLSSLVESSLEQDMVSGTYKKGELELFVKSFAEKMAVSWENQSDLKIDVMQYEPELGILSLRVTALYNRPLGGDGKAVCERTVILNKLQE